MSTEPVLCDNCGDDPAIWRMNPAATKMDLAEAMRHSEGIDPMDLIELCCSPPSESRYCPACADKFMAGYGELLAEIRDETRAEHLDGFAAYDAVADFERLFDAFEQRLPPPLVRLNG